MTPPTFTGFRPSLIKFLVELSENNNRVWFEKNRDRYENEVRTPALVFIEAMEPWIKSISPYFDAIPSKTGGSLMRIHKDIRFSKDKTPYKTNVGIQFRHERGKDVHAPGFYVHLAPDMCFLGVGTWHPPSPALRAIRDAIAEDPASWKKARDARAFRKDFELMGESLKRPPRGYSEDAPCLEDLKRKDHIAGCDLTRTDVKRKDFVDFVGKRFKAATPYIKFLCDAMDVTF
jgi:uncharacterized protein (TIGR02453 family)